ncbi:S41 family peptidase [Mucilaginibacter sp. NFX135]|uniref:S41 family peptidase n=1 Tax=Mucilaginibacter sp. NFX135 TaxID=3402687 RepID=UPI003AFA1808
MKTNLEPVFKTFLYFFTAIIIAACHQPGSKKEASLKPTSADAAIQKLAVKSMHDDLSILWSAIKEMHPAYGMYMTPDSLQKVYDQVAGSIDTPLSEKDFISRIYPLISKLGCGHTQLKHSEAYKDAKVSHLPFEVLVRGNQAWITTYQIAELHTGDEIVSINNVPVAAIIDHGSDLYAGDGHNKTFKELFLSEYDGFEDACNYYYHWTPPYHISLRTKQGALKTMDVNAAVKGAAQLEHPKTGDNYAGWIIAKNTDYLPLRFLKSGSTAWFEVHSYQYNDTTIFKEAFKQIHEKGIKNLIIDLRHNTGGDIRVGAKLLSYLADTPFPMVGDVRSRLPNPAINHFEKYFDTAKTASFNQSFNPTHIKEGAYYHVDFRPVFGNLLGIAPLDKTAHFKGNLLVLIDGATFSSGALSATAIKTFCKNAKFIGRETAGGAEGCSGGTIQHLTLPNTHIVVEFPLLRFVSVARHPAPGRGIMPDYPVEYSPEDIVNKTDPDLKKALSLIR